MTKEKLISLVPPSVSLWAVTEEGTLPVISLALIERETQSSSDGSPYEVRPLFFDRDLGVTSWDEEPEVLGYSLTPLDADQIKEKFGREILRLERRERTRDEEMRKTKAALKQRREEEGLHIPDFLNQ